MYDELVKDLRENHDKYFARDMEAADTIAKLSRDLDSMNEANIALYGALPKWIPVTEWLPEQQDEYLVLWTHRADRTARLFYEILEFDGENWVDDIPQADPFGGAEVLYWIPLPERPKEGE